MRAEKFIDIIGAGFYAGVPDSALRGLCDCLYERFGTQGSSHIICANEGSCAAAAAGYYLATGKIPAVYMQNSGEGNIINPAASLLSPDVYGIPVLFIIGWRGEPGTKDEPQHKFQGKVTLSLLDTMEMPHAVVSSDTTEQELSAAMERFSQYFSQGRQAAIVVKSGALTYGKVKYPNAGSLTREEAIKIITEHSGDDPVVATTGKTGRELFELRESRGQDHSRDLLTVGSMGHCSSIALGIAMNTPSRVWCIDGDGAALMHMGAMAVIGSHAPENLIHIVINNAAHDSVGGMPTAAGCIDLPGIASACGYRKVISVDSGEELAAQLKGLSRQLTFIEVRTAAGSRQDLGRPTTSPDENKIAFMEHLQEIYN